MRIATTWRLRVAPLVLVLVTGGLAGAGWAQTSRPAAAPPATTVPDTAETGRGLLAGPRVSAEAVLAPERPRRRLVPMRRWTRLMGRLDLDPAQRERVRAILTELGRVRQTFRREHGDELETLQSRVRSARRNGGDPAPDDLRRLRALQRLGPDRRLFQQRTWDELTPTQQDTMRREIAGARRPADAAPAPATNGAADRGTADRTPPPDDGDGPDR